MQTICTSVYIFYPIFADCLAKFELRTWKCGIVTRPPRFFSFISWHMGINVKVTDLTPSSSCMAHNLDKLSFIDVFQTGI